MTKSSNHKPYLLLSPMLVVCLCLYARGKTNSDTERVSLSLIDSRHILPLWPQVDCVDVEMGGACVGGCGNGC